MSVINVLVFPAGEINSIELHDALAYCVNIRVFGASSLERHGSYVFENYIPSLPLITEENFLSRLQNVINEHEIDVIFPTHDTVAEFFAENKAQIPAIVINGDKFTNQLCRDKALTYDYFRNESFCPKIYRDFSHLPVFIKPRRGQGSQGAFLIQDAKKTTGLDLDDIVICEYLPGEEYSVDCLTDKDGILRFISPRSRQRVMAGVSVAGKIETLSPEIERIAQRINERLSFLGLWWFQIKRDIKGEWKLLEISTRCAGTMALTRATGVNLPLLSVYTALGREIEIESNKAPVEMDSSLIRRYKLYYDYDRIYLDFDDTVIVRGKVNLKAIWFIYQCKNKAKKIILLSRHAENIYESLRKFNIDAHLFDSIITLPAEKQKADYINPFGAIFIDNSWLERKLVQKRHSIPVYDVDGLDVLMDWRY